MKKLILSLSLLLLGIGVFAQKSVHPIVQKDTDALVTLYNLDDAQKEKVLVIQERKHRNLAEIEVLKGRDDKLFRHKFRAIHKNTDASIRRILNEEQVKVYNEKRLEKRKTIN